MRQARHRPRDRRWIAATVAFAALLQTGTAVAEVLTLAAAEQLALRDPAKTAASDAASRAATADVEKAESAYMPNVAVQADADMSPGRKLIKVEELGTDVPYLVQGSNTLGDRGAFDPMLRTGVELALKGTLYDFGRTRSAVAASRARQAAVSAEHEVAIESIRRGVRASYLQWLGASELLALALQSATDARARRERVQSLIDEGVRPTADLTPAQADEALAGLELERSRGTVRAARLALEQAVGASLPADAEPERALLERGAASFTVAQPSAGVGAASAQPAANGAQKPASDALAHALALQAHAATASASAADHADAPVLSAGASAGVHAQIDGDKTQPFPAYAVGVGLTIPLWDGGSSRASAASSRARAAELAAKGRDHARATEQLRASARLDGQNAAALLQAAGALHAVCVKRLQEAEQAYELGAAGIEPIAQARGALRHAQTEVVLAKLGTVQAALALEEVP